MSTIIVKSRDSLLTTSSGYTNYRGILNLVIILLVLSNARAALENIIKYGILVDPLSWLLFLREGSKHWPALLILLGLGVHILISLATEKIIAKLCLVSKKTQAKNKNGKTDSAATAGGVIMPMANATIVVNLFACISLPPIVVYTHNTHPISTSASLMIVSIVFLKLVSYHMMNYWCRDIRLPEKLQSRTTRSFVRSYIPPSVDFAKEDTKGDAKEDNNQVQVVEAALLALSKYPENISLRNMGLYMLFPTLCYELEYAQTNRIRKRFLIKRIIELIILSQMDMALIQQWIVPTVSNSVLPFRQMQVSHMLERLLKLAVPNHVIWIIWFYAFFHSLLNIMAELTRFADREFYRDWWNSESVYYFWRSWNIPVHKWCARHLYVPLVALGLTKCQASTAVFFVSAFFHEYLVSVPLKLFRMWAFTGMLIQLPWARFVSSYFNNHFANVAVWMSLIIGQPLCILMYYHDYYVINNHSM